MNNKTKITLIENNFEVRNLIQGFLVSKGYEVELINSNDSALQTFVNPSAKTDLIMADANGGSSFITQMKRLQPNTPVILLATNESLETALDGVRAGAFYYIMKQFKLVDLNLAIEMALKQSRLQSEVQQLRDQVSSDSTDVQAIFADYPTLGELEKRYMKIVLEKTKGRKEKAARILGINRRTLYRKEREYGWVTESDDSAPDAGFHQSSADH
jgi:DNA-binding NtrC family response regulator